MNLFNLLLRCAFLVIYSSVFSQVSNINDIEKKYADYYRLEPETIYTHVNKSTYLTTESVWFKSYIYNTKTQLPYLSTINVYATIFDATGNQIDKKMIYAEKGMTHGSFKLKDYKPGTYYLKISTNYMRNFTDMHYSLKQFEILGDVTQINSNTSTAVLESFDFQLLPEGGHLLNHIRNTIGFKILDQNGLGVKIESAEVLDDANHVITNFTSNDFGMGKFSMQFENATNYRIKAQLETGKIIEKNIPKPENKGVILSVNNVNPENLFIGISTNEASLLELMGQTYHVLIHRDGMIKRIEVTFEEDELDYFLPVEKSELFNGVNIITVFNEENKPILERLIYNNKKTLIETVDLLGITKGTDSTQIRMRVPKRDTLAKSLSISVLPQTTKSYNFKNSILSKFLLSPYLKGTIENPHGYFNPDDPEVNYNLDLLLLTQGWSKYDWNTIFNNPIKELFPFEAGIQIKGQVTNKGNNKNNTLLLVSKSSNLMLESEIDEANYFSFENVLLADTTTVYFGLRDKKNDLSKAILYTNFYPNKTKEQLQASNLKKPKKTSRLIVPDSTFSFDNTTILDTITLKAAEKKPINRINNGRFNGDYVDLEEAYDDITLVLDVIRNSGFDVYQTPTGLQILSRRGYSTTGRSAPNIYMDNQLLNDIQLVTTLANLRVNQVEELYISRTPSAGTGGLGGNINIFTKRSFSEGIKAKQSLFSNKTVNFGFTLPQKYYSPYYNKSQQDVYAHYAVLNWIPEITKNKDGEFVFSVPNYSAQKINLYIEGMAADGRLISKIETIQIK